MRVAEESRTNGIFIRQQYDNVIKQTRKLIAHMSEEQRFEKARSHVMDSLNSLEPRPMSYSAQLTHLYYLLYSVQSCWLWSWLVFLLSFFYMYLVILDNQSYVQKISIEASILVIFIFDTIIDFYTLSFDRLTINKRPNHHYFKAVIIALMLVDLILFIALPAYSSRPIRPFRILRCLLPILYDSEIRRSTIALISAYKQLFAFILYYSIIIVGFAFIGSQSLTFDPNFVEPIERYRNVPEPQDPYLNNYSHLSRMIFHMYGVATYDFYPDFQILAVQNYQPNYIFYIVFVFFNMFLFASIPGAVIYNKVRETRSKYIIYDEIKQQHSLILAFVTLAQDDLNLSMDELVKFLFFFYRQKARYVQFITQICLILDDNNNQTIQVNEFMQLSKILIYNSVMFPPKYDDIQLWISFRRFINDNLHLKDIVQHWLFDSIVSFLTLLCAVNALIYLFHRHTITHIFDTIFIWLFLAELIIRIIALGFQKYFAYRWNNFDAFLILLNVIFFFVSTSNPNIDNLFVINRVFRVAFFFRTLMLSQCMSQHSSEIVVKFKRLFETFVQIFPIITRFFLLFAICFFIFGIIGMEIFYETEHRQVLANSPRYDEYAQFSNFKTFIHSQYIMMQVLTEGAWSKVAYYYCWQNQSYYGLIVFLFMIMHFTIVYVLGTLLKGIFWEIYFTVSGILDSLDEKFKSEHEKEEEMQDKTEEIKQINDQINQNQSLEPDTVIRREIIQMKMDLEIFSRIKLFELEGFEDSPIKSDRSMRSIHRSKLVQKMMESWNISAKEFEKHQMKHQSIFTPKLKRKKAFDFQNFEDKDEEDIHSQMEDLLNRLIISSKIRYSYIIAYPKIFVEFLNSKFRRIQEFIGNKFDIHYNPLENEQSMKYHAYEMSSLVDLQPSQRQRKQLIVQCLINNKLIDESLAEKIIKTKLIMKKFHIDTNGALKKMYLSETNQDLIRKLQVEYFSDVYGNTFKQINKVSLGPLLKVQASLTYTLWNILSYPQIHYTQFFHFLTFIQDQFSNKLLKKGSLFKFVYKMDSESDIWFSIEHKRHQDLQVRFIKNGLWTYTPEMYENQIYYARDIFKWDYQQSISDPGLLEEKINEQYMKLFYQSFETLAFSLIDKAPFFESNPKEFIYDLYLENFDLSLGKKLTPNGSTDLRISNIMLVILCKQEERTDIGQPILPYRVSDIRSEKRKRIKEDFLLDDEEKETFEKLKNLSAMDKEKIIETQGLPFSYIINLMKQMSEYLKLYSGNFVQHVQKALNDKSKDNSSLQSESKLSREEIRINLPEEVQIPGSQRFIKPQ